MRALVTLDVELELAPDIGADELEAWMRAALPRAAEELHGVQHATVVELTLDPPAGAPA